jgi:type IV pilus assembly protein PilW
MYSTYFRRNQGFSLIEVMIGMVMGVIVLLVIMQAFALAEGYKRTTTSGTDSQVNGLLALRSIEADVRMAGYGLTSSGAMLCPTINKYYQGTGATLGTVTMPVKIVDGGTGSDSVEVLYSTSESGASQVRITNSMPTPSNSTFVSTTTGINTCDFVLYAAKDGSKACTLQQATGVSPNNPHILTGSGQSNYNPPGGFNGSLFPAGGYTTSDIVINMGQNVDKRYSIYHNTGGTGEEFYLRQTNVNGANDGCNGADPYPDLDKISNIVYMKAQYGIALAGSQQITCWTSATTTSTGCGITAGANWSAPTAVDVKRIKAVRVAVISRSQLAEKPSSGSTCDATTTTSYNLPIAWSVTDTGTGTPPTVDLSGTSANWQCYRYKTYQTIIPLINVIWANI